MSELVEKRWRRGMHDRVYFKTEDGAQVGWIDLKNGREMLEDATRRLLFDAAVNRWAHEHPAVRPDLQHRPDMPHAPEPEHAAQLEHVFDAEYVLQAYTELEAQHPDSYPDPHGPYVPAADVYTPDLYVPDAPVAAYSGEPYVGQTHVAETYGDDAYASDEYAAGDDIAPDEIDAAPAHFAGGFVNDYAPNAYVPDVSPAEHTDDSATYDAVGHPTDAQTHGAYTAAGYSYGTTPIEDDDYDTSDPYGLNEYAIDPRAGVALYKKQVPAYVPAPGIPMSIAELAAQLPIATTAIDIVPKSRWGSRASSPAAQPAAAAQPAPVAPPAPVDPAPAAVRIVPAPTMSAAPAQPVPSAPPVPHDAPPAATVPAQHTPSRNARLVSVGPRGSRGPAPAPAPAPEPIAAQYADGQNAEPQRVTPQYHFSDDEPQPEPAPAGCTCGHPAPRKPRLTVRAFVARAFNLQVPESTP